MNTTIIGTGVAAWTLVRELRKLDADREIRVICADNGDSYSKPMLSNALASGKTAETLVMIPAEKMAAGQKVELISNTTVTSINAESKEILIGDKAYRYDQLVLATGADTINLPLKGNGAEQVICVNDLQDYAKFRQLIDNKRHVAIIGAGLIGCEFANDLLKADIKSTVYDLADRAMPRLLPAQASEYLQGKLAALGVEWKLGREIVDISLDGDKLVVSDSSGEKLTTDCVLSAVGLKPRTQLASAAGLLTKTGIVVNETGQTSDENIFALGDCAEYFGKYVLPYIMPAMNAARALAKTLAGEPTPIRFPAMPVTIKTPDCPTVVNPPTADAKGTWEVEETEAGVKALFTAEDGSLLGMALMGEFVKERQALTPQLPALS